MKKIGKSKEELVYQYLPYSSFEKMVYNKTIKLSNIRKSNDTTELDYGRDVYKTVIFEELEKNKKLSENSKKEFRKSFDEKIKHIDILNEKELHGQFVSCFSKNGDLLSQWRGYSQEMISKRKYLTKILNDKNNMKNDELLVTESIYGGVSVGFSKDYLKVITSGLNGSVLNSGEVIYTKHWQKKNFRKNAQNIINDYIKCIEENGDIDKFWIACQLKYEDTLIENVQYIKNPFFSEEKEFRVCHWDSFSDIKKEYTIKGTKATLSNTNFINSYKKETKNRKIEIYDMYFFIHMGKDVNKFIKHVIIGPRCKYTKSEIEKFLENNGIKCIVDYSSGFDVFTNSRNHKTI